MRSLLLADCETAFEIAFHAWVTCAPIQQYQLAFNREHIHSKCDTLSSATLNWHFLRYTFPVLEVSIGDVKFYMISGATDFPASFVKNTVLCVLHLIID